MCYELGKYTPAWQPECVAGMSISRRAVGHALRLTEALYPKARRYAITMLTEEITATKVAYWALGV